MGEPAEQRAHRVGGVRLLHGGAVPGLVRSALRQALVARLQGGLHRGGVAGEREGDGWLVQVEGGWRMQRSVAAGGGRTSAARAPARRLRRHAPRASARPQSACLPAARPPTSRAARPPPAAAARAGRQGRAARWVGGMGVWSSSGVWSDNSAAAGASTQRRRGSCPASSSSSKASSSGSVPARRSRWRRPHRTQPPPCARGRPRRWSPPPPPPPRARPPPPARPSPTPGGGGAGGTGHAGRGRHQEAWPSWQRPLEQRQQWRRERRRRQSSGSHQARPCQRSAACLELGSAGARLRLLQLAAAGVGVGIKGGVQLGQARLEQRDCGRCVGRGSSVRRVGQAGQRAAAASRAPATVPQPAKSSQSPHTAGNSSQPLSRGSASP